MAREIPVGVLNRLIRQEPLGPDATQLPAELTAVELMLSLCASRSTFTVENWRVSLQTIAHAAVQIFVPVVHASRSASHATPKDAGVLKFAIHSPAQFVTASTKKQAPGADPGQSGFALIGEPQGTPETGGIGEARVVIPIFERDNRVPGDLVDRCLGKRRAAPPHDQFGR